MQAADPLLSYIPIFIICIVITFCVIYALYIFFKARRAFHQRENNDNFRYLPSYQSAMNQHPNSNASTRSEVVPSMRPPSFPIVVLNPGYAMDNKLDIGIALIEIYPTPLPSITTTPVTINIQASL